MRKTIAIICLLALILGAGAAGSQVNPLIARDWLETTYGAYLRDELAAALDERIAEEEAALVHLMGGTALLPHDSAEHTFSRTDGNTALRLRIGEVAVMPQGTLFSVSDAAEITLTAGTLIDITAGSVAATTLGGNAVTMTLNPARRYMLPELSVAGVVAEVPIVVQIDGWYAVESNQHAAFNDVFKDDWFYPAVDFVFSNRYFLGTGNDEFSPRLAMTRSMFVTVLHRVAGEPIVPADAPIMPDVADPAQYYFNAVRWGAASGIVRGYADGNFGPDDLITREEMATMLYRFAAHYGIAASVDPARAEGFPDFDGVADFARDAFRWACGMGIINGADGLLQPKMHSDRAQVAQVVLNFMGGLG